MKTTTARSRPSLAVVATAAMVVSGLTPAVMAFGPPSGSTVAVMSGSTQNVGLQNNVPHSRLPMSFVGTRGIRKRPLLSTSVTRIAADDHHDVYPHYNQVLQPMSFGQHSSASSTYTGYHKSSLATSTLSLAYDFTVDEYIRLSPSQTIPSSQRETSSQSGLADIASAVMLVTGNTVGAGMMAIPQIAAGPGLGMSTALLGGELSDSCMWMCYFFILDICNLSPLTFVLPISHIFSGIYGINLISGLLLAEVAIKQREAGGGDVPSSFKEFAESSLQCSTTAQFISSISIFVNWCILAFALPRAGQLASTLLPSAGLDPTLLTVGVAAALTALVSTQTNHSLSRVASGAVTILFAAFAALLLPGLAAVQDPIGAFLQPGTTCSGDVGCALSSAAPVFLSCMVYQNIVPSVTRLLDYDRRKTTLAITTGSIIPLLMYSAFNLAALGGGLDVSMTTGGPILTAFAAASLLGSSIGGTMGLSDELENAFFKNEPVAEQENVDLDNADDAATTATKASLPSVLMALAPPLVAGSLLASGDGATAALNVAGGYCSPLLYGLLPVVMAAKQRQDEMIKKQDGFNDAAKTRNLVPGGVVSLGVLGVASSGFIFQNLVSDVSDMITTVGSV